MDNQNNFRKDLCTNAPTQGVKVRMRGKTCGACLHHVCTDVLTDLREIFFGSYFLSYELKYPEISEFSLQRYLQNNTDILKSLNFNVFWLLKWIISQ